jgi:hypothetical protein
MAEAFDPYYIWLGIPPEEQPADHYRLLGVRRFEANDEVIVNAADQRVRHLRSMQTGKRQAETQKLLNEISAASGTLLNPDKRKEYDAKLKAKDAAKQPAATPAKAKPAAASPLPVAAPLPVTKPAAATTPVIPAQPVMADFSRVAPRPQSKFPLVPVLVIGAVGLVVTIGIVAGGLAFLGNKNKGGTATFVPPNKIKPPSKTIPVPPVTGGVTQPSTNGPTVPALPPKTGEPTVTPVNTGLPPGAVPRWMESYTFEGQQPRSLLRDGVKRYVSGQEMPPLNAPTLVLDNTRTTSDGRHGVGFDVNPPPAYMLTILLDKMEEALAIDVPVLGRVTRIVMDEAQGMDEEKNYVSGFDLIDGKRPLDRSDSTATRGKLLADRGPHTVTIFVAENKVCANVSTGNQLKFFCNFESDANRLGLSTVYSGFGANRIGITTRGKLEILDVMLIQQVKRGTVASTSPAGTSPPTSGALSKPVDILKERRPKLWGGAEVKAGQIFTSVRPGQVSLMVFDYILRGEYLLEATVMRTGGRDGIQFAIMVDDRPCTIALDCFVDEGRGAHSGLELVNGQRLIQPNYPALYKGDVLTNGKPAKVQIFVRKGSVLAKVDDKTIVDWKGDARQLSRMPVTLSQAGPNVAIGTWMSTYTVESLKISPLNGSGEPSAAGTVENPPTTLPTFEVAGKDGKKWSMTGLQKTNLLRGINRTDIAGKMAARKGMKGIVSAGNDPDRAEFQFVAPDEYILDATFTRLTGEDAIVFGIVVGDRPTAVVVDGYSREGTISGLDVVQGERLNSGRHPAAIRGKQLTNGKPASLRIYVKRDGVIAELDERRIADWSLADGPLDREPSRAISNPRNFSVEMWTGSSYHLESLEVTKVEAKEKSQPAKPAFAKAPVPEETKIAKARSELKETFGDFEQKGKKPAEKLKLAEEFVTVSTSEKDPALRYALLDAARRLALEGQDVNEAVTISAQLEALFDVDPLAVRLETLKLAGGTTLPIDAWESAAELAAELANTAQEQGRLEIADAASLLAVDHAAHSKNIDFKKGIKPMRDKVVAQLKLWEMVKTGEKTLETKPDDPAANLAVGKWQCLHLGDWDKGIPHLAKSGDAKLAAAAGAEKDAKLVAAADAWLAAAEALTGAEKLAAQRHALELYQEASEKLTGLEQLKAAKRVTELTDTLALSENQSPATGGMVPRSKMASDALRPGLLVRIYAGQPPKSPTPAIGIIRSYSDFAQRRDQLAKELKYSPQRLTFAGIGYIDLDRDESILFRVSNGILLVDGKPIITDKPDPPVTTGAPKKNTNPELVRRTFKRGRHSLQVIVFDATSDGPEFSVTRDNGSSVISYSPADLETELARPVLFRGTSAKGKFLLGNR